MPWKCLTCGHRNGDAENEYCLSCGNDKPSVKTLRQQLHESDSQATSDDKVETREHRKGVDHDEEFD